MCEKVACEEAVRDKVCVCERLRVTKLCMTKLCERLHVYDKIVVAKLCVTKLRVAKLRVKDYERLCVCETLCVTKLCVTKGGGRRGGGGKGRKGGRDTEPKARTPHKHVRENIQITTQFAYMQVREEDSEGACPALCLQL